MDLADRIIAVLDELLRMDPAAAKGFIETQIRANEAVVAHPRYAITRRGGTALLSGLGILNALAAAERITIEPIYDAQKQLVGFKSRPRAATDGDPQHAIEAFLAAAGPMGADYVKGRAAKGDRVAIPDDLVLELRKRDDAWQALTAVNSRYGRVADRYGEFVSIYVGDYVLVKDLDVDRLRIHHDDWVARYGGPVLTKESSHESPPPEVADAGTSGGVAAGRPATQAEADHSAAVGHPAGDVQPTAVEPAAGAQTSKTSLPATPTDDGGPAATTGA